MRRPLESRERLFWSASFDLPRLSPALLAAWLTLIDIIMIYLVVTQSMGRFTAFTNEASFVPSLFSKKTLKNDPKGPSVELPTSIETGQFFPWCESEQAVVERHEFGAAQIRNGLCSHAGCGGF
jgi:hypothetical protein